MRTRDKIWTRTRLRKSCWNRTMTKIKSGQENKIFQNLINVNKIFQNLINVNKMEDTLAFLENEIQAFEKILAELNGKLFHKQLSIEINIHIFG